MKEHICKNNFHFPLLYVAGTYKGVEVQRYLRLIVHVEMYESPCGFLCGA